MLLRQKVAAAWALPVALVGLTAIMSAIPAIPANAATAANGQSVAPAFAIICSGDVCAQTKSKDPTSGLANVKEWANNTTFNGHFELTGPGGCGEVFNSPTRTWHGGGA